MGTAEHEVSREPGTPRRPLLGLRRKPGRLALAVFRIPLRAYRHDVGWLLGRTFLEFVHTGRRTGQPYETVAMVLRYDPDAREAVICAGWGPDTDWVRNLRAGPAARVRLGRESFTPQHRFLSDEEAFDVAVRFRREHPQRMRLISAILGWGDLRDDARVRGFIRTHPFVAFRPATTSPAGMLHVARFPDRAASRVPRRSGISASRERSWHGRPSRADGVEHPADGEPNP